MNIELPINEEALAAALQSQMLAAVDAAARDQLVRGAVEYLTKSGPYGNRSPLQNAFDRAVERYASEVLMADEELRVKVDRVVRDLVARSVTEALAADETLRRRVLEAITSVLWKETY